MLKLKNRSGKFVAMCVLTSTFIAGCRSTPPPISIEPPVSIEPSLQERISSHLENQKFDAALELVEQLLLTEPNESSYKLIKAKCLFMINKTPDTRKETEMYLAKLNKSLNKGSSEWKINEKMRVRNFFYMRTPQSARKARELFDAYITATKEDDRSAEELFWGGLISNVCLDEEKGQAYWSKLSYTYIEKQKKELKQYK